MHIAKHFGKTMMCLLLCVFIFASVVFPASAAMVELELVQEERMVSEVHYNASTSSRVIGCLTDGTALTVTGERKNFYKINCAGMRGYIAKDQVMVDDNGLYYVNCSEGSKETRSMTSLTETEQTEIVEKMLRVAAKHLGTPYRYGGTRPGGFDCSGFVMYVYASAGYSLNRVASDQLENGVVVEKEDLQPGDLVFFKGTGSGAVSSHVGIYVGDGKFIHSASSGVRYDELDSSYWARHYLCARRIVLTGTVTGSEIEIPSVKTNRSSGETAGAFLFLSQLQP